jgi:hypothetical protein
VVKLVNDVVRIVDVEIPPGYRTLMHEHALNYAYLMVSSARLRNETPDKPPADVDIAAGLVGYYRASQGAYVHRFTNIGESVFRAIGIELLSPSASVDVVTPLDRSTGYVTVLDNERVRVYRLVLEPGKRRRRQTRPASCACSVRMARGSGCGDVGEYGVFDCGVV